MNLVRLYELVRDGVKAGYLCSGRRGKLSRQTRQVMEKVKERDKYCYVCGEKGEIVHHIRNPHNNNEKNLILLCREHHKKVHKLIRYLCSRLELLPALDKFLADPPDGPYVERHGEIFLHTCPKCGFRTSPEAYESHRKVCEKNLDMKDELLSPLRWYCENNSY